VYCVCLGQRPRLYRAESLSELSACLISKTKKGPLLKVQIIRQLLLSCQLILKNSCPCWSNLCGN
jgi:hypothetical protein